MFDYIFPIFGFGVVITGIVIKGLVMAADMAASLKDDQANVELDQPLSVHSAPTTLHSTPIGNGSSDVVIRRSHSRSQIENRAYEKS